MSGAIRSLRPLLLLLASLNYLLGLAAADYLGIQLRSGATWLGLAWVLLLQATTGILTDAFRPLAEHAHPEESAGERLVRRNRLVFTAAILLTALAGITIALLRDHEMTPPALAVGAVGVALLLAYTVPPARLVYSGFGELIQSVMLAWLPASFAFLLQSGEYHRLIGFATFALVLMGLAWLLALDFPGFATDQKHGRRTLLLRIGWERAVPLHHAVLLAAYSLLLLSPAMRIAS